MFIALGLAAALVLPLAALLVAWPRRHGRSGSRSRSATLVLVGDARRGQRLARRAEAGVEVHAFDAVVEAPVLMHALQAVAGTGRVRVHGVGGGAAVVVSAASLAPELFRDVEVLLETTDDLSEYAEHFPFLPSTTAFVAPSAHVPAWPRAFADDGGAEPFEVQYSDETASPAA